MGDRPRIGITTGTDEHWLPGGSSYESYATAIRAAGGGPVRLDAATTGREPSVLRELDGIVFTGGWDIDLRLYPRPPKLRGETLGERMARGRMRVAWDRDAYEMPLALAATEWDRPVLGICRGCQLLWVALGGRLILDIPSEVENAKQHPALPPPDRASASHELEIRPGTVLASILPPTEHRRTNSRHHQAVLPDDTAPAKVSAVSPADGVVEAIEVPGRRFMLGVQWHPEFPSDPEIREAHRPLFEAFVRASGS
jgi:putative glutamine amidotransferase